ncbi:MAG: TIGR03013 family PEP-CTERM/XrtA system glycosyltransferase, partial [Anaerolineae bacterium]|nr:TIGR03013 family PEP-CTERM/XrtA system glycosyltransferase [Anaerolineae bacterium]
MILLVSVLIGVTLSVSGLLPNGTEFPSPGLISVQAVVFWLAILLGMIAMGLYQRDLRDAPLATLTRLALSFVIGLLLMALVNLVLPQAVAGVWTFLVALCCAFLGIASCRILAYRSTDAHLTQRVLVFGVGERARQIENLRRTSDRQGITIVGFTDSANAVPAVSVDKLLDSSNGLFELVQRYAIDEIVVALDDRRKGIPIEPILQCKMHGIRILEVPDFYERQLGKIRLDSLHPSNVIFADGFTQAVAKTFTKRLFDIVASSILLLLALPVMLLTALAILIESGRPIFYCQERVGLRGEAFPVCKFRSMRVDAEKDGVARWATRNDDRVTRVGEFIRKTRIDELPQLLNVLRGDMSFVGPRPERPSFVKELSAAIPYYDLRHHVKPGITGW